MLPTIVRYKIHLSGIVQGIGLRPKLYQLADQYYLTGFCQNTDNGIFIEWQGEHTKILQGLNKLSADLAQFLSCSPTYTQIAPNASEARFFIKSSCGSALLNSAIAPDLATCQLCIKELNNPNNRRFQYPFISCAQCGPRYSISYRLPFDRNNTSMDKFKLCAECVAEDQAPNNRRFHAQTNSCWHCGPKLWLIDTTNTTIGIQAAAITSAVKLLKQGKIFAIKGIGGFHLCCLANNSDSIAKLRKSKNRPAKPLAIMFSNVQQAAKYCKLTALEINALNSYSAPIIIANKQHIKDNLPEQIAPDQNHYGIFLAYSPIHHLILSNLKAPLIVSSANVTGEMLLHKNSVMINNLSNLADYALLHDRDIVNPIDDSVLISINSKMCSLRLARGFIPFAIKSKTITNNYIALGAQQKNQLAFSTNKTINLPGYFGDLDSFATLTNYEQYVNILFKLHPNLLTLKDYHQDYAYNQLKTIQQQDAKLIYHHHAHIFSAACEHNVSPPFVGFAWDGTGLGKDNSILGSESFIITRDQIRHSASLQPIHLIGNNQAIKHPKRIAFALLNSLYSNIPNIFTTLYTTNEIKAFSKMLQNEINSPPCSSMGRLFDGIAVMLGGPSEISYEGQAAMYLQFLAENNQNLAEQLKLPIEFTEHKNLLILRWDIMLQDLLTRYQQGINVNQLAFSFHQWCADAILQIAKKFNYHKIILSGGVFQNKLLAQMTINILNQHGFRVFINEKIPCNDSGIAVGQIATYNYQCNINQIKQDPICA